MPYFELGSLRATGAITGAESQAQTLTLGAKTEKIIAISDSTNAGGFYKADGTTQVVTVDTTNSRVSISHTLIANSQRVVYVPGGSFTGSMFVGDGGQSLSYVSGNDGRYNTGVGFQSLYANMTGHDNTGVGFQSLRFNTTGNNNTGVGVLSLYSNMGHDNTGVGFQSLRFNTTGNNNTGIGRDSGYSNSTGSANVFIGYQAGYNETGSNKLYIANSNTVNPLIYGDFSTGRVGLSNGTPTAFLDVTASTTAAASLRLRHGSAPTSPNNGDVWTTTAGLFVRINGVTKTVTLT